MPACSNSNLGSWGTHPPFAMLGKKVSGLGRMFFSTEMQQQMGKHMGTGSNWPETGRTGWGHTGEVMGVRMDT